MTVVCNEEPLLIVNICLGSMLSLPLGLVMSQELVILRGASKDILNIVIHHFLKFEQNHFLLGLYSSTFYNARIVNSSVSIYLVPIRTRWDLVKQDETTCVWEADMEIMSCVCWLQRKSHNYHVFEPVLALRNFLKKPYPCSSLFFSRSLQMNIPSQSFKSQKCYFFSVAH